MTQWVAFVSVGVGASQRIPLSVLARNPHIGIAREISNEIRRGRGKECPRAECCIAAYIQLFIYIYNYMRKHSQHNIRTLMNERTYFFIKIYLLHFILERVAKGLMLVMCER